MINQKIRCSCGHLNDATGLQMLDTVICENCGVEFRVTPKRLREALVSQQDQIEPLPSSRHSKVEYDIFISHANEDKEAVARPLAAALQQRNVRVWFDEVALTIGDSLRRSIDRGLTRSRYGVVILSPSFLRKEWPNRELDGLVALDDGSEKVILPVWHNVSQRQIARYSPTLADKLGASTAKGIDHVADQIIRAIQNRRSEMIVAVDDGDPLSPIRSTVLTASGLENLMRCLYEVNEYLELHGSDVDALILRDSIKQAIQFERAKRYRHRAGVEPTVARDLRRTFSHIASLLLLISLAFVIFGRFRTKPPAVEFSASVAVDRTSIAAKPTESLAFVLQWTANVDLDLSARLPDGTRIWFGDRELPNTKFDDDITSGPGKETITVTGATPGLYEVVAQNFTGVGSPEFRLSIVVDGNVKKVYRGRIDEGLQRYVLVLECEPQVE